jgi:hypothetical protein
LVSQYPTEIFHSPSDFTCLSFNLFSSSFIEFSSFQILCSLIDSIADSNDGIDFCSTFSSVV